MNRADRFASSAVLVTGGSGFIGEHLCCRLKASGAIVHVVSRRLCPSHREHFRWWNADLRDVSAVQQVFRAVQPRIVFHLASHVAGARSLEMVLPTFYDNLASTVHVLTAAAEVRSERTVLASSSEEPLASNETPCSPYAAAKWASSVYGRMFNQLFQTSVVMPRIFMTYGPKQKDMQKLVPFVISNLLRGEAPPLSSGRRRADWVYVDDVVEGLLRAAVTPGIEGCAFDLGRGSLVSVREIVEQIANIAGGSAKPAFNKLPDRPFEQERAADTSFLLNRLGYQPQTELKQGLENTVSWYRKQFEATTDSSTRDAAREQKVR